jgi:hypothetical protein
MSNVRPLFMQSEQIVGGRKFQWSVRESSEYPVLAKPYPAPERFEVLRILEAEGEFDIALRVDREAGGVGKLVLGPILVLGKAFPSASAAVPSGIRVRLRPRVSVVSGSVVTEAAVERVIAWCLSEHFRPVQCDRHGSPKSTAA